MITYEPEDTEYLEITQIQYDRCIKNIGKNNQRENWFYIHRNNPDNIIRHKLYKDDQNRLYFTTNNDNTFMQNIYLKVKETDI